jgi:hypothetical protein
VLRRSAGFDVPDFLAAGPRDVLVPQAGVDAAREVLHESDLAPSQGGSRPDALKLVVAIGGGGALAAVVAWVLLQAAS